MPEPADGFQIGGGAEAGVVYHVWDEDWDYAPKAGFYGHLRFGVTHPNIIASLGLSHDRAGVRARIEGVRAPKAVDGQTTSGSLSVSTGFTTLRFGGSALALGKLSYLTLDSSVPTQSLGTYSKSLELTLVESHSLPPDEVEGLNASFLGLLGADVLPVPGDEVIFLMRGRVGVVVDSYVLGETTGVFSARDEVVLGFVPMGERLPIGWFEVHGRAAIAAALNPSGATLFMPSLGGIGLSQFVGGTDAVFNGSGMWTVRSGIGTNLYSAVTGGEIGTSFLRFFAEYGHSWGIGRDSERIGLGGVLAVPDGLLSLVSRTLPASLPTATTFGLYLGGTLQDGFGGRLQMAGAL